MSRLAERWVEHRDFLNGELENGVAERIANPLPIGLHDGAADPPRQDGGGEQPRYVRHLAHGSGQDDDRKAGGWSAAQAAEQEIVDRHGVETDLAGDGAVDRRPERPMIGHGANHLGIERIQLALQRVDIVDWMTQQ